MKTHVTVISNAWTILLGATLFISGCSTRVVLSSALPAADWQGIERIEVHINLSLMVATTKPDPLKVTTALVTAGLVGLVVQSPNLGEGDPEFSRQVTDSTKDWSLDQAVRQRLQKVLQERSPVPVEVKSGFLSILFTGAPKPGVKRIDTTMSFLLHGTFRPDMTCHLGWKPDTAKPPATPDWAIKGRNPTLFEAMRFNDEYTRDHRIYVYTSGQCDRDGWTRAGAGRIRQEVQRAVDELGDIMARDLFCNAGKCR